MDLNGNIHLLEYPTYATPSLQYRTIQTITGKFAEASIGFTIDSTPFLAIASFSTASVLKHNGREFVIHQTFRTHRCKSVAFASPSSVDISQPHLSQPHLLAFSSFSDKNRYNIPSLLYRWNNSTKLFGLYQSLPSTGARTVRFFISDRKLWLAIACSMNGTKTSSQNAFSQLYLWKNSAFSLFQQLPILAARDLYPMVIGCHTFLTAAENTGAHVYHMNNNSFKKHSIVLPSNGPQHLQHFRIKAEHFLAVATMSSNQTSIKIYLINGNKFELHQSLPVSSPTRFLYFPDFQTSSQPVLLVANEQGTISVYKWKHVDSTCE